MIRLIGTDESRYYSWELTPGEYVIGRKASCDFTIPDNTISRQHAQITIEDDGRLISIEDLNSHNGTFVNGERLSEKTNIKIGDRIQFGCTDFKIQSGDDNDFGKSGSEPRFSGTADAENSVLIPMSEALKPLPSQITDLPELLPTLFDMAKMLVLPEPREVMLEKSLELIGKIIPNERLAVLLTKKDHTQVYTAACCLSSGKEPGFFSLSQTILSEILTNKNAIVIDDAGADPRFSSKESIIKSDLKSAMAVPLFDEDAVFGILYADTTNPIKRYNDDYLRLFATVGNIIASKLSNYNLLHERQEKQIFEAELSRASLIQETLVTKEIPEFPGYSIQAVQEQCRAVGGDLYDFTILPDGRLLFLLADVSGKGMGAALLMSNILASFRILYDDTGFDLTRAVNQVSLQMFNHSMADNFATLFIGLINSHTHELCYLNAGHNPPLLVKENGNLEFLEASGTMIGAFDFSSWTEDKVNLNLNDTLIVFTDGITEAGFDDEEYSDERLEKLVIENRNSQPDQLSRIIMKDINNFMGDAPRSDDITMIIIKRGE
ncbi:MAG: SpoIIE family protein phosphatase [candidate division Zixibacteria bacterium]